MQNFQTTSQGNCKEFSTILKPWVWHFGRRHIWIREVEEYTLLHLTGHHGSDLSITGVASP